MALVNVMVQIAPFNSSPYHSPIANAGTATLPLHIRTLLYSRRSSNKESEVNQPVVTVVCVLSASW